MLFRKGMKGPAVANLQRALLSIGFKSLGDPDGDFGVKTENVIKYIQKAKGLTIDGIAGPDTLDIIDSLYEPNVKNFSSSSYVKPAERKFTGDVPMDSTYRRLEGVHPTLKAKALKMIELAAEEGVTIRVSQGLRTFDEQNALFGKRPKVTNAKGGQSSHNYGVATDFVVYVNGKVTWDVEYYKSIGRWASQVGLTWGGNWRFKDMPHVQLSNTPHYSKMLGIYNRAGGGAKGIAAVWKQLF